MLVKRFRAFTNTFPWRVESVRCGGLDQPSPVCHRLVTGTPERLSLPVLAALCDILDCAPGDLVDSYVAAKVTTARKAAGQRATPASPRARNLRPTRASIVDRDQ